MILSPGSVFVEEEFSFNMEEEEEVAALLQLLSRVSFSANSN